MGKNLVASLTGSMNRNIKKWRISFLIMLLLIQTASMGLWTAAAAVSGVSITQVQEMIDQAGSNIISNGLQTDGFSDWAAIGLARAGKEVPGSYLAYAKQLVKQQKGQFNKVTDLERIILGVQAAGADPQNFAGYSLIDIVVNHSRMINQGANGPIYALLILGGGKYTIAEDAPWNETALIDWLLQAQGTDSGWSLISGGKSTVDVTAMALTALAPYKGQVKVQAAIDKAIASLSKLQLSSGGFNNSGENSETAAQVIIALTALNIDPTSPDFTKSGGNVLTNLVTFGQPDGGFAHMKGGSSNGMATEQALLALDAYQLFINGNGRLYQKDDQVGIVMQIEGPQGSVITGKTRGTNVLEALESLLKNNKMKYIVVSSSFGKYVSSINGIDAGLYGGYDGWGFYVQRGGKLVIPSVGMADYTLLKGDKVIIHYSDYGTPLIHSISTQPAEPKFNETFLVKVNKLVMVWADDGTSKEEISAAAGVTVQIGKQSVVTDKEGIANFQAVGVVGPHKATVSGYKTGAPPLVIHSTHTIGLQADYADRAGISDWALTSVQMAQSSGLMVGVSRQELRFNPKNSVTRAEFATILMKLIGESPTDGVTTGYADVNAGLWYSGYIAAAKLKGAAAGITETKFAPNQPITRQDAAMMLAKALQLQTESGEKLQADSANIKDLNLASGAAIPYITAVFKSGLMIGSNGNFMPRGLVTREMAAVMAIKALNLAN
ncbi:MAG TPA: S-layer homology domain-containing protein [Bacilli bacterium]